MLDALFWVAAAGAVLLGLRSVKGGRHFISYVERRTASEPDPPAGGWPAAALIVPVKGAEPGLASNLLSLRAQDYPRFELVVCFADSADPAVAVARATLGTDCRFVCAGPPPLDTGEKIHNLAAAVRELGDRADVLVFADSDGDVPADWMRKLVAPLAEPGLGATTGYRWHFPQEGGFWPLLRSQWDSAVLPVMDRSDRSFAWGGGTAIRRAAFVEARVAEHWQGTVSDDLRLTRALERAGQGIRFLPEAMVASRGQCTRSEFLSWAVRQATLTRVYRRKLWAVGCVGHAVYCGAQLLALLQLLAGNWIGMAVLGLILLLSMVQGGTRAYACSLMFPGCEEWLERHGWAYFWMAPISTWVWFYALLRAGLTRRIRWRGRTYELRGETASREIRPA